MCGRYATTRSVADLSAMFLASVPGEGLAEYAPSYNVAPTDPAPIIRTSRSQGGRVVSVAKWGLIPSWADDPRTGAKLINARAETVATSRAFAPSFAGRRALIPADGWYEWLKLGGAGKSVKQPYFMTHPDGLVFAGLWTASSGRSSGYQGLSCSIITTAAVGDFARIHDRMPLLLEPDRWADWLGEASSDGAAGGQLLTPPSAGYLAGIEIRPVGSAVGSVRNDGPELIARVTGPAGATDYGAQESLF